MSGLNDMIIIITHTHLAIAVVVKVPVGDDGKRSSFRKESPSQPLIDPADNTDISSAGKLTEQYCVVSMSKSGSCCYGY